MRLKGPFFVFAGPSVGPHLQTTDGRLRCLPPVKRGDIEILVERFSPATILIIDGTFGETHAVSIEECKEAIARGWTLLGAASMGAIRAADLWPIGFIGIGMIYDLLRIGALISDADFAVAMHPRSHEEQTISMVHVRSCLAFLAKESLADTRLLRCAVRRLEKIDFRERDASACRSTLRALGLREEACVRLDELIQDSSKHPKIIDARLAISLIVDRIWPSFSPVTPRGSDQGFSLQQGSSYLCRVCHFFFSGEAAFCPVCSNSSHELAH
jgi:hypothetical protein